MKIDKKLIIFFIIVVVACIIIVLGVLVEQNESSYSYSGSGKTSISEKDEKVYNDYGYERKSDGNWYYVGGSPD